MTSTPTVAVIGAGISGLTALTMLDDYDIGATCFEASDRVGKNWAFDLLHSIEFCTRVLHAEHLPDGDWELTTQRTSADQNNHAPPYKRMFSPGIDDLAFVGFAQSTPTLFSLVEAQARLVAAWAAGIYRTPPKAEMEAVIVTDEQKYIGHMLDTSRHQQQVDHFLYEHDLRTREIPPGRHRATSQCGMIQSEVSA